MDGTGAERPLGRITSLGSWTTQDAEDYEAARELINALIAEYSAQLVGADPAEAERLRTEQLRYVQERRSLSVSDRTGIDRVLAEYPELIRQVRGEAW